MGRKKVTVQYVATSELEVREQRGAPVCSARDVAALMRKVLELEGPDAPMQEHFWAVGLNAKHRVRYVQLVGMGGWDRCPADAKVVLRQALLEGASRIILSHNHPSGDPAPSGDDTVLTERLLRAAATMDITLVDHVIVTTDPEVFASLAERGAMVRR